jgi:hypothetical protein
MTPCYSDGNQPPAIEKVIVEKKIENPITLRQNAQLLEENKFLTAGLCAIITELNKIGIANKVISQASKSGLIDLMKFWHQHAFEDEVRIAVELHKFSEHEQEIIKRLLNEKETTNETNRL